MEPKKVPNRRAGGLARKASLSAEQLSNSGQKAALARWGKLPLKATHKGNFQEAFGTDVECYVLNDAKKTPVLSQRGMGRALGLSSSGAELPRFLATKAMSKYAGGELGQKLAQPIKFEWVGGGGEIPQTDIFGFDATLLIDLCRVIVHAEQTGDLGPRNKRVAEQAHVILSASAKAGIQNLVYALSGYNPSTQEVIDAFKLYVQEEARKYEKEFPPELYQQWHRLYNIPVLPNGRPWFFKHFTVKHIYYPLAKSNGKILDLIKALKAQGGDSKMKLFQFLNEIGARALRMHMGRILEMAETSKSKDEYEAKIVERFGGQQQFELKINPTPEFNEKEFWGEPGPPSPAP